MNTTEYHQTLVTYFAILLPIVIPLWFFDVIGNVLVLVCVFREKKLHRPSYYLVAALSAADIAYPLFGFVPMTYSVLKAPSTVCSLRVEYLLILPADVLATSSFFHIVTLTVERYCSVAFPIFHRKTVTSRRIAGVVVCLWVFSFATNIAFFPFSINEGDLKLLFCSGYFYELSVFLATCGTLGMVLLTVLNVHLLVLIKRRSRVIVSSQQRRENLAKNAPETTANPKANRAISIIVFCFVVFWMTPTVFLVLDGLKYRVLDISESVLLAGRAACIAMFNLNGAINPIVYARRNPHFNIAFKKLLGRPTNKIDTGTTTGIWVITLDPPKHR